MQKPVAVTRFQTSDGKLFPSPEEAQAHEDFLRAAREFSAFPADRAAFGQSYETLVKLFRKYPLPTKE